MKVYQLIKHYKQGDDLNSFLEEKKDSKEALLAWANYMEDNAKSLKKLVNLFKDKELNIDVADTHYIQLSGDNVILKKASELGLIYEDEEEEN